MSRTRPRNRNRPRSTMSKGFIHVPDTMPRDPLIPRDITGVYADVLNTQGEIEVRGPIDPAVLQVGDLQERMATDLRTLAAAIGGNEHVYRLLAPTLRSLVVHVGTPEALPEAAVGAAAETLKGVCSHAPRHMTPWRDGNGTNWCGFFCDLEAITITVTADAAASPVELDERHSDETLEVVPA